MTGMHTETGHPRATFKLIGVHMKLEVTDWCSLFLENTRDLQSNDDQQRAIARHAPKKQKKKKKKSPNSRISQIREI
jgi:hypothetical protein